MLPILVHRNKIHDSTITFEPKYTQIIPFPDFDTFIGVWKYTLDLYDTSTGKWKNLYTIQEKGLQISLCVADGTEFFFVVTNITGYYISLFRGNRDRCELLHSTNRQINGDYFSDECHKLVVTPDHLFLLWSGRYVTRFNRLVDSSLQLDPVHYLEERGRSLFGDNLPFNSQNVVFYPFSNELLYICELTDDIFWNLLNIDMMVDKEQIDYSRYHLDGGLGIPPLFTHSHPLGGFIIGQYKSNNIGNSLFLSYHDRGLIWERDLGNSFGPLSHFKIMVCEEVFYSSFVGVDRVIRLNQHCLVTGVVLSNVPLDCRVQGIFQVTFLKNTLCFIKNSPLPDDLKRIIHTFDLEWFDHPVAFMIESFPLHKPPKRIQTTVFPDIHWRWS